MKKILQGTFIWFIATLFVVYAFFLNTAGAVFSDTIKSFLHASDIGVAYAVGSFIAGFACMQIPAGYLLDRYNIRFVVGSGLFLLALGNLTLSFSTNLFLFSLSNFIQGIGASFAFLAAAKLTSQWFSAKMFPILFGLTQSFSCILAAIIHYYLVLALQTLTWQAIYQELAICGFILLCFSLIFISSPPTTELNKPLSLKKSLSLVLKNKQIWLCALSAATSFGVLSAYASFWYMDVEKFYSVKTTDALIMSGLIFTGIGVGTPLLGWLSNRFKSRKLIIHVTLVLGTMFLLLGIYLPHFDIDTYIIIRIVAFFTGFLLSGSMLYYTCASELATNSIRAVALGVINTFVFLFNSLLLFLPQFFITKASPTFLTYLWVLPFCLLISILLTYFVKETFDSSSV
ncbi:MAG: MFS transporter [Chlamydiales bacterium]|nr:MFS transporter [Chlamydiales bacterium]